MNDPTLCKLLPQNTEAEASLLSAIIINNNTYNDVEDILNHSVFYDSRHRIIYEAIADMRSQSEPVDLVTLMEHLKANDKYGDHRKPGKVSASYLSSLVDTVPLAVNAPHYAEIIRSKWVRREVIRHAEAIRLMAMQNDDASGTLEYAEKAIYDISLHQKDGKEFSLLKGILKNVLSQGEIRQDGISTGYTDLDGLLGGLHPSDLVILAARPGMGKTSLALNIARNIANDKPVAMFSMEMTAEQLGIRMLCSEASVNMSQLRQGALGSSEYLRLTEASERLSELKIAIDDSAAISASIVRSKSRRLRMRHGLGLIVVDYVQLMKTSITAERRDLEIGDMSRAMKQLAKELDVPILLLSQLNRKVEERADRRPLLSDLRESGALEQDADVVIFIYRDEVYNKMGRDEYGNPGPPPDVIGKAEIIVAKHRNGPIGTVPMRFRKAYTRFEDVSSDMPNYQVA